jgi:hypothetical protein
MAAGGWPGVNGDPSPRREPRSPGQGARRLPKRAHRPHRGSPPAAVPGRGQPPRSRHPGPPPRPSEQRRAYSVSSPGDPTENLVLARSAQHTAPGHAVSRLEPPGQAMGFLLPQDGDGVGALAGHSIPCRWPMRKADSALAHTLKRALPGPMGHLGDKADLTPSPLRVSGSHGGGLTGETNDVVRCYGFALTEQASVTLLMPRRNHCSPTLGLGGMELSGIEPLSETLVWTT